jgi:cell division protein FtsN
MKHLMKYVLVGISAVFLIQACGPNEAELQQREQARLDSLERVRLERVQQSRLDSIAVAQRLEAEAISQEEARRTIQYQANGRFTVQVGSWRSQTFANEQLELWKRRGFVNAYIVEFGNEEVGDVWFRVRLGRVASRDEALKLQDLVVEDYNIAAAWISSVQ